MRHLRLMVSVGLLATLLTGCGTATAATSSAPIPYPSAPQWLSVWVPQTHQYVWVNPTTMPVLLVNRQDLAAGRLLRHRLRRLRTTQPVGVVITNPPLAAQHPPTILRQWAALGLPVGYLVGPSPVATPVTWIADGAHHRITTTSGVPSLAQLAHVLHAAILPATASVPPSHGTPSTSTATNHGTSKEASH